MGIYYYEDVEIPYLCFTANTAGSKIYLSSLGGASSSLETSTDGVNWNNYTLGTAITLSNVGDKVYWRNTDENGTSFSSGINSYLYFEIIGSAAASGDINYLINKNSTDTVPDYAFFNLFYGCTKLTSAPNLTGKTVGDYGYKEMFSGCTNLVTAGSIDATTLGRQSLMSMFYGCTNLETLPKIKATSFGYYSCDQMFMSCSKIKLSATQTGEYQTAYRIPTTGTGTDGGQSLSNMFYGTGGTFRSTPTINTTYYTSNTLV